MSGGFERLARFALSVLLLVFGRGSSSSGSVELSEDQIRREVAFVAQKLESENEEDRIRALRALTQWPAYAAPALPRVVSALRDPASEVRRQAAFALTVLPSDPQPRARALVAALEDVAGVRSAAAFALGCHPPDTVDEAVEKALRKDAMGPGSELRLFAAFALKRLGLTALGEGSMEKAAAGGRGLLSRSLDADDTRYPGRLAWAVSIVDPSQGPIAATELARGLRDDRVERRAGAEIALRELGNRAPAVAEELARALESDSGENRADAIEAIGRMGVASQVVIDSLLGCLADPDFSLAGRCALSLGRVGASTREVRDRLAATMTGIREELRVPAGRALLRLDPGRFDRELERLDEIDPQRARVLLDHRRLSRL